MNAPNSNQADRDALDDFDGVPLVDRVGHSPHALRVEEVVAE